MLASILLILVGILLLVSCIVFYFAMGNVYNSSFQYLNYYLDKKELLFLNVAIELHSALAISFQTLLKLRTNLQAIVDTKSIQ